jgi:hypothetical protein
VRTAHGLAIDLIPLIVNQKAAVVCLAMLIYYIFATELAGMLKLKTEEKEEKALRRKKIPQVRSLSS